MARTKANTIALAENSPTELIQQVITQLDAKIAEWTSQRDQLSRMIAGGPAPARRGRPPASSKTKVAKADRPKRKFSAATRKKLKEAAKARWAKAREERGEEKVA